jgi:FixJ family two-component response regulator
MISSAQTVCLVDDEPGILRGLARLLESNGFCVHTFASAQTFLEFTDTELPACVVLDISLPGKNGLQVQAELVESEIDCPIVFLSGQADISMSVQAMRAGAVDFLTKPVDANALIDAVGAALQRHAASMEQRGALESLTDRWRSLTPREREVCQRVAAGQLNKEIAASLGSAEKTIKVHRGRVMKKMQARRVADLVRMASQLHENPTVDTEQC